MRLLILSIFGLSTLLANISFISDEEANKNATKAYKLAQMYENGDGIDLDMEKSFYWYKRASALFMGQIEQEKIILTQQLIKENKNELEKALVSEYPKSVQNSLNNFFESKAYFEEYLDDYDDADTSGTVIQAVTSTFGLMPYYTTYFLPMTYDFASHDDARKKEEIAFQISLRKDLAKDLLGLNETYSFGYTQRSWWQITADSAPFRETNYAPELFVFMPLKGGIEVLKGAKLGFMHESNGQDGDISRAWNRLYLEGLFQYKGLFFVPRIWYIASKDNDNNGDIKDYLGYGDLNIIVPYKKHLFKLMVRNNFDFDENKGAAQVDWTFPLGNKGLFAYIQFFSGYGESLIDYNQRTQKLGAGISFSR